MFHIPFFLSMAVTPLVTAANGQVPDCFKNGNCIVVQRFNETLSTSQETASNECRQLNDNNRIWNLIKLDTLEKMKYLKKKIELIQQIEKIPVIFWVGLRRDNATSDAEASNLTLWRDRTKWKWPDGTALDNESIWIGDPRQPDNYNWINSGGQTENCAICMWRNDVLGRLFHWPCKSVSLSWQWSFLLVCESYPVPTESTSISSDTTIPEVGDSGPSTKMRVIGQRPHGHGHQSNAWIWIVVGVVGAVALTCAITFAVVYAIRRRRRAAEGRRMTLRSSNTNDTPTTADVKPIPEMDMMASANSLELFKKSERGKKIEYEFSYGHYIRLKPKKTTIENLKETPGVTNTPKKSLADAANIPKKLPKKTAIVKTSMNSSKKSTEKRPRKSVAKKKIGKLLKDGRK